MKYLKFIKVIFYSFIIFLSVKCNNTPQKAETRNENKITEKINSSGNINYEEEILNSNDDKDQQESDNNTQPITEGNSNNTDENSSLVNNKNSYTKTKNENKEDKKVDSYENSNSAIKEKIQNSDNKEDDDELFTLEDFYKDNENYNLNSPIVQGKESGVAIGGLVLLGLAVVALIGVIGIAIVGTLLFNNLINDLHNLGYVDIDEITPYIRAHEQNHQENNYSQDKLKNKIKSLVKKFNFLTKEEAIQIGEYFTKEKIDILVAKAKSHEKALINENDQSTLNIAYGNINYLTRIENKSLYELKEIYKKIRLTIIDILSKRIKTTQKFIIHCQNQLQFFSVTQNKPLEGTSLFKKEKIKLKYLKKLKESDTSKISKFKPTKGQIKNIKKAYKTLYEKYFDILKDINEKVRNDNEFDLMRLIENVNDLEKKKQTLLKQFNKLFSRFIIVEMSEFYEEMNLKLNPNVEEKITIDDQNEDDPYELPKYKLTNIKGYVDKYLTNIKKITPEDSEIEEILDLRFGIFDGILQKSQELIHQIEKKEEDNAIDEESKEDLVEKKDMLKYALFFNTDDIVPEEINFNLIIKLINDLETYMRENEVFNDVQ